MRIPTIFRKRFVSESIVTGGLSRVAQGIFGTGSPASGLTEQASVNQGAIYRFHQGDLFLPGTGNYVLDPPYETPLMTNWGHAFLVRPNAFQPLPRNVAVSSPIAPLVGIGGQISGQLVTQPLSVRVTNTEPALTVNG